MIPDPAVVGAVLRRTFLDYPGPFSFEDGYPDIRESEIAPTDMVNGSPSPEFDLVIPADTNLRTLKIYGSVDGGVQMTASLSDGSAPAISDGSISNTGSAAFGQQPYYYAISYNAASAGQTLTVKFIGQDGAYIYLDAGYAKRASRIGYAGGQARSNPTSGIRREHDCNLRVQFWRKPRGQHRYAGRSTGGGQLMEQQRPKP